MVIAIDGPAASGKGTIAAAVARALGFHYLDSGSLYRLVALKALRTGTPLDDAAALARLAQALDVRFEDGALLLDGADAAAAIREEAVSAGASRVAVHGGRPAGADRPAAGLPAAAGAGRRRPRHGHRGLPGRPAQGVRDGHGGGAGAPTP